MSSTGFLEGDHCTDNGILFFDEVMTGFRLAKGGVQELLNVNADIVCFGKVIGAVCQ
jgi:glutamate-1-semialdehyde 2,1-aminomutase